LGGLPWDQVPGGILAHRLAPQHTGAGTGRMWAERSTRRRQSVPLADAGRAPPRAPGRVGERDRPAKEGEPGRGADCRARVLAGSSVSEVLPHPLRTFARSLQAAWAAAQPAEGSPSTTCAAAQRSPVTTTWAEVPRPGSGSGARSCPRRARWLRQASCGGTSGLQAGRRGTRWAGR
jgi:hypothetical protein